mmetsp:Transcript_38664/g.76215  ORF Transcript_38664/g.76215 Transcript_38664/m.76215 type:complete len:299 (-) Transcript_38664:76-972(-)
MAKVFEDPGFPTTNTGSLLSTAMTTTYKFSIKAAFKATPGSNSNLPQNFLVAVLTNSSNFPTTNSSRNAGGIARFTSNPGAPAVAAFSVNSADRSFIHRLCRVAASPKRNMYTCAKASVKGAARGDSATRSRCDLAKPFGAEVASTKNLVSLRQRFTSLKLTADKSPSESLTNACAPHTKAHTHLHALGEASGSAEATMACAYLASLLELRAPKSNTNSCKEAGIGCTLYTSSDAKEKSKPPPPPELPPPIPKPPLPAPPGNGATAETDPLLLPWYVNPERPPPLSPRPPHWGGLRRR